MSFGCSCHLFFFPWMVLVIRINVWDYRLGSARLEHSVSRGRRTHVSLTHFGEHVCIICVSFKHEPLPALRVGYQHGIRESCLIHVYIPNHCQSHVPQSSSIYTYFSVHKILKLLPDVTFLFPLLGGINKLGQKGRSLCKVPIATGYRIFINMI